MLLFILRTEIWANVSVCGGEVDAKVKVEFTECWQVPRHTRHSRKERCTECGGSHEPRHTDIFLQCRYLIVSRPTPERLADPACPPSRVFLIGRYNTYMLAGSAPFHALCCSVRA